MTEEEWLSICCTSPPLRRKNNVLLGRKSRFNNRNSHQREEGLEWNHSNQSKEWAKKDF